MDDNLDTHDTFKNDIGYYFRVKETNKIEYYNRIIRSPENIHKIAVLPLMLLMIISLATTSFGDFQSQMGNLLAV